ncbi:MAG: phage tail sheath family protein [Thermoanaerobaculia bacterium]
MPVQVSYPGVYVEELPSTEKTVTGVSTSTTAFVDCFARGPMSNEREAKAQQLFNYRDFQRIFGGLYAKSEASYAIMQFFQNGGQTAWVVRTDDGTGVAADLKAKVRIPFLEDFAKDAADAAHDAARMAKRASNVVRAIDSVTGAQRSAMPKLQPGAAARAALADIATDPDADEPTPKAAPDTFDELAIMSAYLRSALSAAEAAIRVVEPPNEDGTLSDGDLSKEYKDARVDFAEVDTRKETPDLKAAVETSLASTTAITAKAAKAAEPNDEYGADDAALINEGNDGSEKGMDSLRAIHYSTGYATQAASDHLTALGGEVTKDDVLDSLDAAKAAKDEANDIGRANIPPQDINDQEATKKIIEADDAIKAAADDATGNDLADAVSATQDALTEAGGLLTDRIIEDAPSTFGETRDQADELQKKLDAAHTALAAAREAQVDDATADAAATTKAINEANSAVDTIGDAADAAIQLIEKNPEIDTEGWPDLALAVEAAARLTEETAEATELAADAADASSKVLAQRIREKEATEGKAGDLARQAARDASDAAKGARGAAENAKKTAERAASRVTIKAEGTEAREVLLETVAEAREAWAAVAEAADLAADAADDAAGASQDAQVAAIVVGEAGAAPTLKIAATSPGEWGNSLKAEIIQGKKYKFGLTVQEFAIRNGRATAIATEEYSNLTLQDEDDARFAIKLVNHESDMVKLSYNGPAVKGTRPIGEGMLPLERGHDGEPPGQAKLIATMKNALDNIAPSIFNILCLPITATYPAGEASVAITSALGYCEEKRAFMILDIPENVKKISDMQMWHKKYGSAANFTGAVYYPRLVMPDPLQNYRPRNVGPSGTLAGVYARTDSRRGIWKAPAGIEAVLKGVKVASKMTDNDNGILNPLGVNCLRAFPVYGNISWGARTLAGADLLNSQWKYVNVRRLTSYIEETLYQNLKWAVFEGNDENLWSQIRTQVGGFLSGLFVDGAFAGSSPDKAYFVHCDSTTTTPQDIANGIVNIVVGIAPIKPAEFIILQIEQIAGQE